MVYEIWDLESGNAVGDFDTAEAALAEVRAMVEEYGRAAMLPWALEHHDGNVVVPVADGERLINLALGILQDAADRPNGSDAPHTASGPSETAPDLEAHHAPTSAHPE